MQARRPADFARVRLVHQQAPNVVRLRILFCGRADMKASSLSFKAAVVLVVIAMLWGLQMAISGDHSAHPAHAHLNLLGWVCLFLFGIYYRLHPALERSKLALTQIWIWIVGVIIQAI